MAKKKGGGGGGGGGSGGTPAPRQPAKQSVGAGHAAKPKPKAKVGGGKATAGPGASGGHAGETYNPGVRSAPIDPFMTAEDIMSYANARNEYLAGLNELDFSFAQSVANTGYEKGQITKGAISAGASTKDDMAARGLQRSSVRDAELFDIDATAEMRKAFLDSNLNTLKLHTEAEKTRLNDFWNDPATGYLHGMDLKKVQNAQAAGADAPEFTQEPGWEKAPGAGGPPKKPAKNFQHAAPVQRPGQRPSPPTKTGGTQYPAPPPRSPSVGKSHKVMGKNYGK